jgi:cardiolipin synthase A/B
VLNEAISALDRPRMSWCLLCPAKVIEADYGTAHPKVFVGSENFSSTSLNDNRELGLIISSHAVMSAIASTFATDFRNGQRWS